MFEEEVTDGSDCMRRPECDGPLSLECRSGMGTAAPPPLATAVAAVPADASIVPAPLMHLERLNGYTGERTALKGKLDGQVPEREA